MGHAISWDLLILIFFIVLVAYGFLMQRDRTVVTMIAIYVGLVLASILVSPVQQFFTGDKAFLNQVFIRSNTNAFTIQTIIFLATIFLVTAKSGIEAKSNGSMLEILGFSFLNGALIITSIIFFMDPARQDYVHATSKIARFLMNYHVWWLILPVIFLIVTGWNKKTE